MNNETNTEQVETQPVLDITKNNTEEAIPADTQANEEDKVIVPEAKAELIAENDAPLNDKQQHEVPHDFESPQVNDGGEQDKEATDETDMSNTFTISENEERPNDEQQHVSYDDFGFYENFFREFADEHDLTYTREQDDYDFKISLKAEENTTHIQIDHGRNLTMTAKDNNGETVFPDQQMFDAIAELAHQQGSSITFGNIKTPEYAARLYLACKTHQPPIEMIGMLEMNDEFLGKLNPETKEQIEMLVAQETESKQDQTYDEAPTDNQENDLVEEVVQEANEDVTISIYNEAPTESHENGSVEAVDQYENKNVILPSDPNDEIYTIPVIPAEDNANSKSEVGQSQEEASSSSDEAPTESLENEAVAIPEEPYPVEDNGYPTKFDLDYENATEPTEENTTFEFGGGQSQVEDTNLSHSASDKPWHEKILVTVQDIWQDKILPKFQGIKDKLAQLLNPGANKFDEVTTESHENGSVEAVDQYENENVILPSDPNDEIYTIPVIPAEDNANSNSEVSQSQADPNYTNNFATNEEVQQHLTSVWNKKHKQKHSTKKTKKHSNNKKAQAPTIPDRSPNR